MYVRIIVSPVGPARDRRRSLQQSAYSPHIRHTFSAVDRWVSARVTGEPTQRMNRG